MKNLTEAAILERENLSKIILNDFISDNNDSIKSKYLLVIKSRTSDCLKLTIYPLNNNRIIKITLREEKISNENVNILINILKNLNVLHTSGLTSKGSNLFYECYLNYDLLEIEDQSLGIIGISINKLKDLIKNIKIEEITLNKRIDSKNEQLDSEY
ncbi:MAG: hypothetical protein KGD63_03280 [Candidatus Lokiarchaeota archaeon]|nr:hypothetical protein [Candidatus Lokiarchaeota archaeon]